MIAISTSSSSSPYGLEKKKIESHHHDNETNKKKLERMGTNEDVNAKADAFIKNFRHHLLLQRLQSQNNYDQWLPR
ncbi:hypothetical protein Ahy_A09g046642 [Arachis hypogaea]|uniref:Uncharacterized protein n=1 Tax=Arachis hypogaea TaxID=3818 RepID=A0A445BQE6_ARAHY|nr:hypothetical protein Ahy_A09g046642 [Arachis hypogaea]